MRLKNHSIKQLAREVLAFGVALSLSATVASGCQQTGASTATPSSTTPPVISSNIATTSFTPSPTTNINTKLPQTIPPPAPLSDYPILGEAYNPPDPGQPENSFYMDAYELRPNLLFIKAGTLVTFVNVDNKPFFIESVDELFFGITSPLGLSWSYVFDTPGVFAFTVSPYNATEIGVIVVTP